MLCQILEVLHFVKIARFTVERTEPESRENREKAVILARWNKGLGGGEDIPLLAFCCSFVVVLL